MKRGRDGDGGPMGGKRPAARPPLRAGGGAAPAGQQQTKLTTNDALSYLREVKNRFADNKEVYDTFLEIMKEFKAQRVDTSGVIVRVKQLFKGHKELILGFNTFLPKGYEIELARSDTEEEEEEQAKQPVEFDQAINYVNKIKTRFANDERVYKAFLEILNMYRKGQKTINNVYDEVAVLFRSHADLLDEFTYFLPDNSQPQRGFGNRIPQRGAVSPDVGRFAHKRKAAKKAEEGFRAGYGEDFDVGRGGVPGNRGMSPMQREMKFFDNVKQRLRNRDAYMDLLRCMSLYTNEVITRTELLSLVHDVIGKFPDLMSSFHDFVKRCEEIDPVQAPQRDLRNKEKNNNKFWTKPLSEIVAQETERITPSYVKMPVDYPKIQSSGRTDIGNSVLNDTYVNVITGSEDYSFKLMRKNQYEESLFRCEDDRYEFEMCIETNMSALRFMKSLMDRLLAMGIDERNNYKLEDNALSPVHAKAIDRLYADQGATLLDMLKKHPAAAVPVVVQRMEQKDQEWRRVKEEMTKVWRKIYEQNYHKSLDHRSFYFKQGEKKLLLPKAMVQEVRERAEARRQAEVQQQLPYQPAQRPRLKLRAGVSSPLESPDISFDYSSKVIFNDCWVVLRTAINETLLTGVKEQVLEFYLRSVEPFFGLPLREEELARVRAEAQEKAEAAKAGEAPVRTKAVAKKGPLGNVRGEEGDGDTDVQGDEKSESSDQEGADKDGDGDSDGKAGRKGTPGTPAPEATPEPGARAGTSGKDGDAAPMEVGGDTEDREGDDDASADLKGNGASVDESEDGRDSEPGGKSQYRLSKPLASFIRPAPSRPGIKQEEGTSGSEASPSGRLLLCNELMYIFFRFHRHLFDRLWTARRCAEQQAKARSTLPGGIGYRAPGTPLMEGMQPAGQEGSAEVSVQDEADRMHSTFMDMMMRVLQGDLETSVFEDQCRALLGTNSYELFTVDKLIQKLVNHMRLMVADDQSTKLWELYRYEHARSTGVNPLVYHINCHAIMDDTCYRMQFSDERSQLGIQVALDLDKQELMAAGAAEGYLTDYIRAYVSTPAGEGEKQPEHKLFLKRSLAGKAMTDQAVVQALSEVSLHNGLECKISCTTSKVSYVLDMEDVMYRRRRQTGAAAGAGTAEAAAARQQRAEARRKRAHDLLGAWFTQRLAKLEVEAEERAKQQQQQQAAAIAGPAALAAAAAAVANAAGAAGGGAGPAGGAGAAAQPGAAAHPTAAHLAQLQAVSAGLQGGIPSQAAILQNAAQLAVALQNMQQNMGGMHQSAATALLAALSAAHGNPGGQGGPPQPPNPPQ